MLFHNEEEFPQILRLSPFATIHHKYNMYEESIHGILD